ncbi:MAG TPA: glycosyltransferase family 4 protein [Candidatus Acidoferrales bacterium]|nr:glycosyltransferase family 4 protein [Candidatus Acidoferrales bacterium]
MSRKLVYLVTEDWYFISHRLPMAHAARDAGFEVHVATRVTNHRQAIEREGFVLHALNWERGSLDPLHFIRMVASVRKLYRTVRPSIVHHVAIAPTIVGSLAAIGLPFAKLNALAGLGFFFTSRELKARTMRRPLSILLPWLLRRKNTAVLVQNPDDSEALESAGVRPEQITIIPGSGVDTEKFQTLPEPPQPIVAAFVGRLLYDKGLETLISAYRQVQRRNASLHLLIAGEPDPANPASIPDTLLEEWKEIDGITFLGQVNDIGNVWRRAHIAVLPSRREGLPLSLLEAAACGRPLIATDVPGCREVARAGINALLVPPDNPHALAEAIAELAANAELRRRFGAASRHLAEAEFSSTHVAREITELYHRLLLETD